MIEKYVCPSCQKSIEFDDSSCEEFVTCSNCGEKFRSPNIPMLLKGTRIGDYIIEKRLGTGGMGEVYLAEQQSMMRPVALKILQPDLLEDQSYLERFYREVRILAKIEHPNIVNAIETGYEDNICYFSMSYIKGNDLKHRLDHDGKMSEIDALYVILNIAEALKFVWEKHKLIHRDIKPANIILTEEHEVKLMDLGISKIVTDDKSGDLTMAGMVVGSPYYISPEQAKAEKDIDWRADMYSLGASFYHMLVGSLPFDAETPMGIIAAHLSKPIPDPRKKVPSITDNSANIVGRMMQKEKEKRFSSWNDAIESIDHAIEALSENGAETTILSAVPRQELGKKSTAPLAGKIKKKKTENSSGIIRKIKTVIEQLPLKGSKNNTAELLPATEKDQRSTNRGVFNLIFGNLYIRFIILVLLLFLTFISFFKVVRDSIHEAKAKKAKASIEKYISLKPRKSKTKKGREELYAILMNIRKIGLRKSSEWAEKEIQNLEDTVLQNKHNRKKDDIQLALNRLKNRSYELEKSGKTDDALKMWREYKNNGAFADELHREIKEAINFLILKKKKKSETGIE